ncbi:hypothetical protein C8A00DRAFT_45369 [Chaetomidium leptoderma]|uniref:Uncharacterized protein n=1 Tax=Chaetomidium leptoderma TaxID=669021 RepID=A0AAN6ZWG5_9PEZI|nr:hypothetical protein C8A00DRAFT_45369 [Chaetomidium leptoderma]
MAWLLRSVTSVRRDNFTDSPVLAVEKLNSLPRPLQDSDREILVGAVLTMSSSLHLALGMLQEILPQEDSREQLGEILCPTLGHLFASLRNTLCSFEGINSGQTTGAPATPSPKLATPRTHQPSPKSNQLATARQGHWTPERQPADRPVSSSTAPTQTQQARTRAQVFPPLDDRGAAHRLHVEVDIPNRPETHLVKALQEEMRVQAAIHVAIESLEFAEGQLKVVKEVNQLHGGNFDPLQRNFYEGYNRLLFRALELQRRELGSLSDSRGGLLSTIAAVPQQLNGPKALQASPKQHQSVSFQSTLPAQPPAPAPRANGTAHPAYSERRPLGRRNTIQGIKQEDSRTPGAKPPLKRRLSLAQELAMVGEDSEGGYQDETSEMASSASELDESDVESCSGSRNMRSPGCESEEYSTNAESAGEESAVDSDDDEDIGDKTLDALETTIVGFNQVAVTSPSHAQSKLPRLQQTRR